MGIRLFKMRFCFVVAIFATPVTHGAYVLSYDPLSEIMEVANDEVLNLSTSTAVCVYEKSEAIACGKVVQQNEKSTTILIEEHKQKIDQNRRGLKTKKNYFVELKFINATIKKGDCVDLKNRNSKNTPCSVVKSEPKNNTPVPEAIVQAPIKPPEIEKPREVTATPEKLVEIVHTPVDSNLSLGVNYVFPELHFQQRLSEHLSLGVTSLLVNYLTTKGNTLKGYSGLLTVNYYQSALFEGVWVQAALGVSLLSASNSVNTEQLTLPSGSLLLGWHWKWDSGFNFGLGAGAQYLFNAKTSNFELGFDGLWPAIVLELGFCL